MLNDKIYKILKWVTLIALPALTALWLGLGQVWGFPYLEQIGATLAILTTFIGALIGVSTAQYNKANKNE